MRDASTLNLADDFVEVLWMYLDALWIDGLEAITEGLCDSENLILTTFLLTEACLFVARPSSCLGQIVEVAVHHSLHCLDNTRCEAEVDRRR